MSLRWRILFIIPNRSHFQLCVDISQYFPRRYEVEIQPDHTESLDNHTVCQCISTTSNKGVRKATVQTMNIILMVETIAYCLKT
jgi:hypothetical protein